MAVTTKTRVIDLAELRGDDDFPAYVSVYSGAQKDPFVLSPAVMQWSEHICISRLEACRLFWLAQKKKRGCKLAELFDPLLAHHYGEDYIAVFGDHPWQCLTYLYYQQQHAGSRLYWLQSRLDQNIFKSLDWACWFAPQTELLVHLTAINARGFKPNSFAARQAQLRRFIQRVGVSQPSEMKTADANSMQRRFGHWLARIWRWSFCKGFDLEGFPWIQLVLEDPPLVKRDLEFPASQWSTIEPLLVEDCERLCDQFVDDRCQHINRMRWQITLFNQQKMTVELSFRHPYSLHRDRPNFATALYQARYVYDDMMGKLSERQDDLDLPESMPFIAWQVSICERIQLAPMLLDLFAADVEQLDHQQLDHQQLDHQQIMSLQNKLPVAFECYQSSASFLPEHSYQSIGIGEPPAEDYDLKQWSSSACDKPLFCYHQIQAIEAPNTVQKIFLERNASQWWLSEELQQSIRDYFQLKDHRGRRSWVYRTVDGLWFKHGEYY